MAEPAALVVEPALGLVLGGEPPEGLLVLSVAKAGEEDARGAIDCAALENLHLLGGRCEAGQSLGEVLQVLCETGDWIRVPAGTKHWFDMGPRPRFTAIRFFDNPEGWVANFTGDAIAKNFPPLED